MADDKKYKGSFDLVYDENKTLMLVAKCGEAKAEIDVLGVGVNGREFKRVIAVMAPPVPVDKKKDAKKV